MKKLKLGFLFLWSAVISFAQVIDPAFAPSLLCGYNASSVAAQGDEQFIVSVESNTFLNTTPVAPLFRINKEGKLDTSFHCPQTVNLASAKLATQKDGKILVGGLFTDQAGNYATSLMRLLPDGAIDPSFKSLVQASYTVRELIVLPNQKILILGFKPLESGQSGSPFSLQLLQKDGLPDPTFVQDNFIRPSNGRSSQVTFLGSQSSNAFIVGGSNLQIGARNQHVFKFDSLGKADPAFNPMVNVGVRHMAILPDGTLGIHSNDEGNMHVFDRLGNQLIKYPLSLNLSFLHPVGEHHFLIFGETSHLFSKTGFLSSASGLGLFGFLSANGRVNAQANTSKGQIIIAGNFAQISGLLQPGIASIQLKDTLAALDPAFSAGIYYPGRINDLHLQKDGKLIVTGFFNLVNGQKINHVVRLLPDGTIDPTFNLNIATNGRSIYQVEVLSNGKLVFASAYNTFHEPKLNGVGIANKDGYQLINLLFPFSSTSTGAISYLQVDVRDKIYAAENFGNSFGQRFVRYNAEGTLEADYDNLYVQSLLNINGFKARNDRKLYIFGQELRYDNSDTTFLVRAMPNGERDRDFRVNIMPKAVARTLLPLDSNSVLVSLANLDAASVFRPFLIRLDSSGQVMESFKANIQGKIENFSNAFLAALPGGKILFYGGDFEAYNGRPMRSSNILIDKKGNFLADFLPHLNKPIFLSSAILDSKTYYLGGLFNAPNGAVSLIKVTDFSTSTQNLKTREAKKGKIFPNPNADANLYLELDPSVLATSKLQYQICEAASGKLIRSGVAPVQAKMTFEVKNLPTGSYVLRLVGEGWEEAHVFTKVQ